MLIIPSIDISGGKAVKRIRGVEGTETIREDPFKILNYILNFAGKIRRLHIVDLDGAKIGKPINYELIINIAKTAIENGLQVQVGGGIRCVEHALMYVSRDCDVVLGSILFKNFKEAERIVKTCGNEKVFAAIDVKNGKIAIQGWTEIVDVHDVVNYLSKLNIINVIHTSIDVEGMLTGPKPYIELVEHLRKSIELRNLFYAGGVRDIHDVSYLENYGFNGAIIGMAMYSKGLEHFIH